MNRLCSGIVSTKIWKGNKFWMLNGDYHREDGPAIEWTDGDESWFILGKLYTKEGYLKKMRQLKIELLDD